MTGDSEKVFHRSLDILHIWIRDCKQVDFTPESSLVEKLEKFLHAEVYILYLRYFNVMFHYLTLTIFLWHFVSTK